jgi:hypothetical protein
VECCAFAEEVHVFLVDLAVSEEQPVTAFGTLGGAGARRPAPGEHPVHCGGVFGAFGRGWVGGVFEELFVDYVSELLGEIKEAEGNSRFFLHLLISFDCPEQQ